ncbi:MAG: response regulator [Mariprofundaceae bacterium]
MKRSLVVEDNEQNMYLISFILKKHDYEVTEAINGEEAIELLMKMKGKPDLIVMDVQLPGIDGLETTRRIRRSGMDGDVSIIAVTSFAMPGDKEHVLEAGCNGYIEKPIDPETFMAQVEACL